MISDDDVEYYDDDDINDPDWAKTPAARERRRKMLRDRVKICFFFVS